MLNGEALFGSYASDIIDITREEYDRLPTSQKNNDKIYNIIDEDVDLVAAAVDYDHTDSGLNANTVQSGIDELAQQTKDLGITKAIGFDNVDKTKLQYVYDATQPTNYCIGVSIPQNEGGGYGIQIASSFWDASGNTYTRYWNASTFSAWSELAKKDDIKNTFNLTTLHEDITPFTDADGRPIYHYYIELPLDRSTDVQFVRNLKFDDGLPIREIINYDVMFKLNDTEENVKFKDKICGYDNVNNYEAVASVDIRGNGMIVFRASRSTIARIHVWYTKNS